MSTFRNAWWSISGSPLIGGSASSSAAHDLDRLPAQRRATARQRAGDEPLEADAAGAPSGATR